MDERRLLIFFLISLAILLGWQYFGPTHQPVPRPTAPATQQTEKPVEPASSATTEPAPAPEATPPAPAADTALEHAVPVAPVADEHESEIVVAGQDFRAVLSNRGAQLVSFELRNEKDHDGKPVDLVRRRQQGPYPLGLVDGKLAPLPLDTALFHGERSTDEAGNTVVTFTYRGAAGACRKQVTFLGGGLFDLQVEVAGAPGWGLLLGPGIRNPEPDELKGRFNAHDAVYRAGGKVETQKSAKSDERVTLPGAGLDWVGLEDTYFLTAVLPSQPLRAVVLQPVALAHEKKGHLYHFIPFDKEDNLKGDTSDLPRDLRLVLQPRGNELLAQGYFGAKEYEKLASYPGGLEKTVSWGMFGFIARPLLWGLNWFHAHGVPNYGWCIVLMTVLLKVVMFPLTHKSYVSMQKMQELQPKMQAIRQRYRGKLRDKKGRMDLEMQRKQNEEIQELFRSEGASPTGGCLPLLLQMPIFFAFYRLLFTAVELRHEPWLLWIKDLSVPDPYYILPIVMGLTQAYQQRLTPSSAEPMQRRIMQLFPWMFMIFAFGFPSGLVLYWTVNNGLTILQTAGYKKWKERRENGHKGAKGKKGNG